MRQNSIDACVKFDTLGRWRHSDANKLFITLVQPLLFLRIITIIIIIIIKIIIIIIILVTKQIIMCMMKPPAPQPLMSCSWNCSELLPKPYNAAKVAANSGANRAAVSAKSTTGGSGVPVYVL